MDHGAGEKHTAFTWAMGRLILQRIADGDTMRAITADPRMPAYCTAFRWMLVVPEFGDMVRRVRALQAQQRLAARDAAAAARGPKRRSGRRSTYSDERAAWLLDRLKDGGSLSEVVAEPGAPSFKAVYRWLRDRPGFRAAYIEACDVRDWMLDYRIYGAAGALAGAGGMGDSEEMRELAARRGRVAPRLYRTLKAAPGMRVENGG
jgi:hypothetical protein